MHWVFPPVNKTKYLKSFCLSCKSILIWWIFWLETRQKLFIFRLRLGIYFEHVKQISLKVTLCYPRSLLSASLLWVKRDCVCVSYLLQDSGSLGRAAAPALLLLHHREASGGVCEQRGGESARTPRPVLRSNRSAAAAAPPAGAHGHGPAGTHQVRPETTQPGTRVEIHTWKLN